MTSIQYVTPREVYTIALNLPPRSKVAIVTGGTESIPSIEEALIAEENRSRSISIIRIPSGTNFDPEDFTPFDTFLILREPHKILFPPLHANLLGPLSFVQLRSDRYDLDIVLLGERHVLKVECQRTNVPLLYIYEYFRDYVIPHFFERYPEEILDIYVENYVPRVHQEQIRHPGFKGDKPLLSFSRCEKLGGPLVALEECHSYNLNKVKSLFRRYPPNPYLRVHSIDFRHDLLYGKGLVPPLFGYLDELDTFIWMKALEAVKVKDIAVLDQFVQELQAFSILVGPLFDLALEDPGHLVYKYHRELNAIEDLELRQRADTYVGEYLVKAIPEVRERLKFLGRNKWAPGYYPSLLHLSTAIDIFIADAVNIYGVLRLLRDYTSLGKEGPRAHNAIVYMGAAHTEFYLEFLIFVAECYIVREVNSNRKGNHQCLDLALLAE